MLNDNQPALVDLVNAKLRALNLPPGDQLIGAQLVFCSHYDRPGDRDVIWGEVAGIRLIEGVDSIHLLLNCAPGYKNLRSAILSHESGQWRVYGDQEDTRDARQRTPEPVDVFVI